jgi:hypothetical protein
VRGIWVVVAALGLGFSSTTAHAQTGDGASRAAARKLGYDGVEAFQAGQFATASQKLEKAYAVLRVPSLGIWSARALVKQGKLIEAADRYVEVLRLPPGGGDPEVQKQAQLDAQSELEETQRLTPTLVVQVEGASEGAVSIKVDGSPLPAQLVGEASPLNPGHHQVVGEWAEKRVTVDVTLPLREQKRITLNFAGKEAVGAGVAPPAGALPSSADGAGATSGQAVADTTTKPGQGRRALAWVVLGGGGVGLALGAVTGALAMQKRGQLDENQGCAEDHVCPRQLSEDVDSLNTMRNVSTVGFIAGGVLASAGVVLLLTAPKQTEAPRAALWLSPTSLGVRGQF